MILASLGLEYLEAGQYQLRLCFQRLFRLTLQATRHEQVCFRLLQLPCESFDTDTIIRGLQHALVIDQLCRTNSMEQLAAFTHVTGQGHKGTMKFWKSLCLSALGFTKAEELVSRLGSSGGMGYSSLMILISLYFRGIRRC